MMTIGLFKWFLRFSRVRLPGKEKISRDVHRYICILFRAIIITILCKHIRDVQRRLCSMYVVWSMEYGVIIRVPNLGILKMRHIVIRQSSVQKNPKYVHKMSKIV